MDAKPGDKVIVKLEAVNVTSGKVKTVVVLNEFHFDKSGKFNYEKIERGDKGPYSLIPYATVPNSSFFLEPGEKKEVSIEVNLPKDYKGSKGLLMSVRPDEKWMKAEHDKARKLKTGLSFSVNYRGPLIITAKDTSKVNLVAKNKISYKRGKLRVSSFIELKGNSFLSLLEGKYILLKDGKVILQGGLSNISKLPRIYPGNSRKFSGGSSAKLKKGKYKLVITYFDREYKFSKTYTEELSVK